MSIAEKIQSLMDENKISRYKLSKDTGVAYTTLTQILNERTKNPQIDSIKIIADYFNVPLDSITSDFVIKEESVSYDLNKKEENDIADELERMMQQLDSDSSISFHGEKIEMDEDEKELLRISFENSLRVAKQIAKKKFTPKKKKN